MTLGEKRVRVDFNTSGSSEVDEIKAATAEIINNVNELGFKEGLQSNLVGEFNRLKALALTAYEEAAMWAVKAATL